MRRCSPTGGAPNFLTGAGGFLQAAFGGYSGLRVNSSGLYLDPTMPEATTTLGLRGVSLLGARLDIQYGDSELTVGVQAQPSPSRREGVDAAGTSSSHRRETEGTSTRRRVYADACSSSVLSLSPASSVGDSVAAAAVAACRVALHVPRESSALSLLPRDDIVSRSQRGRVRLGDGWVVPPQPLQLVDSAGGVHALTPGVPITLPRQAVRVVRAAR